MGRLLELCSTAARHVSTDLSEISFVLNQNLIHRFLILLQEAIQGLYYNEGSDIFSMGVVFFEIVFRIHPPYPSSILSCDLNTFAAMVLKGLRPDFPLVAKTAVGGSQKRVISKLQRLITEMWSMQEDQRPRVQQVSDFINQLSLKKM
jgi:serine/threonine protein kinase